VEICPLDFVQRMASGDKHLFRCAASVWTGAAEVPVLDEGDGHPRRASRPGDRNAGIAATEHDDIEPFRAHFYLAARVAVIDRTTAVAILN
jgi:hypothetical protein